MALKTWAMLVARALAGIKAAARAAWVLLAATPGNRAIALRAESESNPT
jgi:hypothetical protein